MIPLALRASLINWRYNQTLAGYQLGDTYSNKQDSKGCQEQRTKPDVLNRHREPANKMKKLYFVRMLTVCAMDLE